MGLFASDACISICWDVSRARRSSACSWTAHNAHSVDARATGAAHTPAALCRSPHTVRPRNLRRVPWRAQRDLHARMRRPDTHARAHVLPRSPDELSSCKWAAAVYPSALRAIRCCAAHPARPPLRRTPFERSPRDLHDGMPRVATRPRARWRASSVDRATMCADTCCLALQCPRRHGLVPALPGPCPRTAHACALRAHARTAVPRIAS